MMAVVSGRVISGVAGCGVAWWARDARGANARRDGLGEGEGHVDGAGSFGEELNRRGTNQIVEGERRMRIGQGQGRNRHRHGVLACHPKQYPARHQDRQARATRQQPGQDRRGGEDVLEVVHHEQDVRRVECRRHGIVHEGGAGRLNVNRVSDRRGHQAGVADRLQWDEADTVGEGVSQIGGELEGEARLADAARPVSVRRRRSGRPSSARATASSRSRPTSEVNGTGRPVFPPESEGSAGRGACSGVGRSMDGVMPIWRQPIVGR